MDLSLFIQGVVVGLLMGGVISLVAVGLFLVFGVMKIINFAHGAFMMLGMYIGFFAYQYFKVDPYLSILLSIPLLFLLGILIQRILIRPVLNAPNINQLILTLGLMLFLENIAARAFGAQDRSVILSYGSSTFSFQGASVSLTRLGAALFSIGIYSLLYFFLKKTDTGKAIRAAADEKYAAQLVGINVHRINLLAFGIGSACVGAAGSVVLSFYPVSPYVGSSFLIAAFVTIVLGGETNLLGVFLSAMIIGLADSLSQVILFLPASLSQAVSFTLLIIILLFKPTGIFGTLGR